jgi:hypothetical protein
MEGHLLLIHWNDAEAAEHANRLRAAGWRVELETKDGARAARRVRDHPPEAVVIYLTRLPSHGRETAHYLKSNSVTKDIPIIFVDGEPDKVKSTQSRVPEATYTSSDELNMTLENHLSAHHEGRK